MNNITINKIANKLDQTFPFVAATALNRFEVRKMMVRNLQNVTLLDTNAVTFFLLDGLDMDERNNRLQQKVENIMSLNGNYLKVNNANISYVETIKSILQVEGLGAKHSVLRLFNSSFQNNRLVVQTKNQQNTGVVTIQGEIAGRAQLNRVLFSKNTIVIQKIPTSGYHLAPNLVMKSQRQKINITNSLFEEGVVDVSVQSFAGTKDAFVSGFSTLFSPSIWVFVKELYIDKCNFVRTPHI